MFEAESWVRNGQGEKTLHDIPKFGVMNMEWLVVNKDFEVADKGNEISRLWIQILRLEKQALRFPVSRLAGC